MTNQKVQVLDQKIDLRIVDEIVIQTIKEMFESDKEFWFLSYIQE